MGRRPGTADAEPADRGPGSERGILDTSVLIAATSSQGRGQLGISAVSMAEPNIRSLVARPRTSVRAAWHADGLQRRFDALPVDDAVADSYGRLAARLVGVWTSTTSTRHGLLIAATAMPTRLHLYTRNAGDLRGLEDLLDIVPVAAQSA